MKPRIPTWFYGAALALLLFAGAAFASAPGDRAAEQSRRGSVANGNLLIYRELSPAKRTLFTVKPDGSDVQPLMKGLEATWSADGRRLAVVRWLPRRGLIKLFVGDEGGRRLREVFPRTRSFERAAAWSPDGQWLVVPRSRGELPRRRGAIDLGKTLDLWLVSAHRSSARRLAGGSRSRFTSARPSWSPDGREIAFIATPVRIARNFRGKHVGEKLYVMNADGTQLRLLTRRANASDGISARAWSPDGDEIVYVRRREGIRMMSADGRNDRLTRHDASAFGAIWSPDGRKIAFTRDRPDGTPDVYVMRVDGSGLKRLTQGVAMDWQSRGR